MSVIDDDDDLLTDPDDSRMGWHDDGVTEERHFGVKWSVNYAFQRTNAL
jgi:hypothetical protein